MPDKPLRLYGPASVGSLVAQTLYTAPSQPPTTTFIRDITFANITSSNIQMRMSIGSLSAIDNRVFDFTVPASDTYSFRGLWILAPGDLIQAQQITLVNTAPTNAVINGSAVDATSFTTAAWTPAAATLYLLSFTNNKTDAPDVISAITGNGTWTSIATATSGSVAAKIDERLSMFYWYSSAAGSSATTTIDFGGGNTQLVGQWSIDGYTNVYFGDFTPTAFPTVPIVQSATAVDTVAPASTASGLATTFAAALTGGLVHVAQSRQVTAATTSTPPTGFTELTDLSTGSENNLTTYYRLDATSTTNAANTWSGATTNLRASIAAELVSSSNVNIMINGIEVS